MHHFGQSSQHSPGDFRYTMSSDSQPGFWRNKKGDMYSFFPFFLLFATPIPQKYVFATTLDHNKLFAPPLHVIIFALTLPTSITPSGLS